MAKKVLEKKSFATLKQFRRKKDIAYNDEILCTFFEPNALDFNEIMTKIFQLSTEKVEDDTVKIQTIEERLLPLLVRKTYHSEEYSIDGMTDEEILEALNSFGQEIKSQIDIALKELAMDKINQHIANLTKSFNEELDKEGE